MFDIAWSELLMVVLVAVVVIGPKDLPKVMREAGRWVRRIRAMSSEFRGHLDDLVREADLEDIRDAARDFSPHGLRRKLGDVLDAQGEIRDAFVAPSELSRSVMIPPHPVDELHPVDGPHRVDEPHPVDENVSPKKAGGESPTSTALRDGDGI